MNKLLSVAQLLLPIFAAPALGIYARKKQLLTESENNGLQKFVLKFGIPCVLFGSTLTASLQPGAVSSMALLLPCIFLLTLAGFALRKKRIPLHNFPQLLGARESGTLGIPLYMTLFGAGEAYRMGMLDLTQAVVIIPVISILSADSRGKQSPGQLALQVLRSPLLILSLAGLVLNLTGTARMLEEARLLGLITGVTGFLSEPVSAVILFSAGYSFSITRENRAQVLGLSAGIFAATAGMCLLVQGGLCLLPQVDSATRWAVLLYCALPSSYLAPSLGRTGKERTIAAGVCSLLTVVCLAVYSAMAIALA